MVSTTDALAKVTTYGYNEDTGVQEWVQYPEDTEATRTEYTYDSMYRMATAACTTSDGANQSVSYTYEDDRLTVIQTPSTRYSFDYLEFGLRDMIYIGDFPLAEYTYTADRNRYLQSLDYGNINSIDYTYDKKGRLLTQTYEDGDTVEYQYDNNGNLAKKIDSATGRTTTYFYDLIDRMVKYEEKGTNYFHSVSYEYDKSNNLSEQVEVANGVTTTTTYTYDNDNRIKTVTTGGSVVTYSYDDYGRVSQKLTEHSGEEYKKETYTYTAPSNTSTSSQIATHTIYYNGEIDTYTYTYDGNGNLTTVSEDGKTIGYVYDSANQLLRENDEKSGYTNTWTYDNAGNITSRNKYAYTTAESLTGLVSVGGGSYVYGDDDWGDLLTEYNGNDIEYDDIGNPIYDGDWEYTWEHGRQLSSMTQGNSGWTFTYNADGMRTKRTNGTATYEYIYNGSLLTQMKVGSNVHNFSYDANGVPLTVTVNNYTYYYITNIRGDVVGLLDADGVRIVTYTYDAWGNCTVSGDDPIADYNPLRYRGYVYDVETQLYYLQSRYYDPEAGRFINSDIFAATGQGLTGNNMFAYCGNNPVSRADVGGYFWDTVFDVVSLVASVVDVVKNPTDVGAWVGLAMDVVDVAIPCVGGLGEIVDAVNVARKTSSKVGNAIDAARAVDNAADMADNMYDAGKAFDGALCFVAGTMVLTWKGHAAIETIQPGDQVWAWDERTGDIALKKVVETYINETDEIIHLFVNGEWDKGTVLLSLFIDNSVHS